MPQWSSYLETARERGSLAFEVFAVVSEPVDPALAKQALPDHLAYQKRLETEGALMLAGPMSDESGTQMAGIGLIILRAATFEDARALADADPMHKSGARRYTLRRWMINEGNVTLNVRFANQSATLA